MEKNKMEYILEATFYETIRCNDILTNACLEYRENNNIPKYEIIKDDQLKEIITSLGWSYEPAINRKIECLKIITPYGYFYSK